MKNSTQTYYQKKVKDVLHYIHNHLSQNISIKELAEYSGISYFHFHRILKGALAEPIGSYMDKVRLDTAVKLIRYSNDSINSISDKIGYNNVSSFSKAFSKEFGISPQEFKLNSELLLNTHIDYRLDTKGKIVSEINPKIILLPDKQVIFINITGEYGGKEVVEAWDRLLNFITQNKLLGWNPEFFSIYYDDPDIVERAKCTSDLCFTTKKIPHNCDDFKSKLIEGGKYAVFRYKGPYERLWDLYGKIYGDWLLSADYKLRDVPLFEKYINYSAKTKPENFLTEIYIPIE
jgi:AraC family transcriptional regulator